MQELWKKSKRTILLCLIWMVSFTGCQKEAVYELEEASEEEPSAEESASQGQAADEMNICVYICGAVAAPGVYELDAGSRVIHAVQAAGGLTEEACRESLNQARLLADGEQITVLTLEEAKMGVQTGSGDAQKGIDGKININTADAVQLTTLTGIGGAKAEAILAYREEHGRFQSVDDLKKVDGIADKTFEKIRDKITVD